jgi:hypothetical protein
MKQKTRKIKKQRGGAFEDDVMGKLTSIEEKLQTLIEISSGSQTKPSLNGSNIVNTFRELNTSTKQSMKKVRDPSASKKKLPQGMLAWQAFVKDLQETKPELFLEKKITEKENVAHKYKTNNPEEYTKFVENFTSKTL